MGEFISIILSTISGCAVASFFLLFAFAVWGISHGIKSFNFLNKYLSWAKHFSYDGSVNQLLSPFIYKKICNTHTHTQALSLSLSRDYLRVKLEYFLCMIFEHDTDSLTSIKECPWEIVNEWKVFYARNRKISLSYGVWERRFDSLVWIFLIYKKLLVNLLLFPQNFLCFSDLFFFTSAFFFVWSRFKSVWREILHTLKIFYFFLMKNDLILSILRSIQRIH